MKRGWLSRPVNPEVLERRYRDILRLMGEGRTSQQIAKRLGLTEAAITYHRHRLRQVLGLKSNWELVRYAILKGARNGARTRQVRS